MSPAARRFFGCLLPVVLAAGGCGTCALVTYASQMFVAIRDVDSSAMAPALQPGDSIIVDNTYFWSTNAFRGQIVWAKGGGQRVFRRVAGIPGDTVQVTAGKLMVNGTPIREPYAQGLGPDYGPETLGADAYFLLADHRDQPDSRSWGPVTRKNLFGSASFIRGDSLTSMVSVVHAPFSKQLDALP